MKIINLGNRVSNNYIFHTKEGYMLIDTGYENNFSSFCKKLKKHNIGFKEISYIFITHAHDDHVGFLRQLLNLHPHAKVILHPKAIIGLQRGQNSFCGGCSNRLALLFCKALE